MAKFTISDWHRHTIFFRVDACQLVNSKMEIKMILSNFDLQHFGTYHTSFCHMAKFTTSDWHRHTIFVRVDACQLVNSKMEIKRFRQILTCDILEPQRRYVKSSF